MQSRLPASQKILFLSDIHLGAFSDQTNSELENELINLLNFAEKNRFQVAVLGDLFDYWIEYHGFIPSLGKKLLQRFERFNTKQNSSLYITGNHDNWTLGHFRECGFDVEPDYHILHINKQKVLLLHGDAIGNDVEHLKRPPFHQLLRNRTFLKIYRSLLPPNMGLWLMKEVSKWSSRLERTPDDISVLNKWTKHILEQSDFDYILCGHDHVPRCLEYSFGTYLNLGTFCSHKSMVMYNKRQFKLVCWNSNNQQLIPLKSQETENEQLG